MKVYLYTRRLCSTVFFYFKLAIRWKVKEANFWGKYNQGAKLMKTPQIQILSTCAIHDLIQ